MGRTKKTTEEFKQEMLLINPNIEILEEYVTTGHNILVRDKTCGHEWNTLNPKKLLQGSGCPICNHTIFKTKCEIKRIKNRIGEINYNKQNLKMTIIDYRNSHDIDIQFEDGTILVNRGYNSFSKGTVYNPYCKITFGVGYLGEGKYSTYNNYKMSTQYRIWHAMMKRCYDKKELEKSPAYKDCSVVDEWHNFQVFAQWYDNNYYTVDDQKMCVDKDILHKGNKIYSPINCIIVPERINTLFIKGASRRGNYPIGVYLNKRDNTIIANCKNIFNKTIYIGTYSSPEEAFYKGYKPFKEKVIKEVADYYKNKIPDKLYNAMYNWAVEITD